MLVKPNETYVDYGNNMESDLYRKFRNIFSEILHPDDSSYDIETYCQTKNSVETKVEAVINNFSDSIVPILGYTGMGKTFLMHYCLRKKYGIEGVIKNKSLVVGKGNSKSIIIYASYDAHRSDGSVSGRLAGKIAAASVEVMKSLNWDEQSREKKQDIAQKVARYIRINKSELLEEGAPATDALDVEKAENLYQNNQLAYEQEKIKWLLTDEAKFIKQVIIILDDIEGIVDIRRKNSMEYELINTYLKMYDCLRREDDRGYKVKLFLCMRERTYNEVKKCAWYNTHRSINDPFFLTSGINLGEIFMKRFLAIEKKSGVLDYVTNKETWDEAKSVLNKLSKDLEDILGNSILEICNYNVSDAVQLFASILANRQWTQKSEKMQASFKIDEYQYYYSQASCLKAIAMKNSTVFTNKYHLTNLFVYNDRIGYCLPIYLLLMMTEEGNNICELSEKQIQNNFMHIMKYNEEIRNEKMEQIEEVICYFLQHDILFEKTYIVNDTNMEIKYYVSPKGRTILNNFFASSLLLEIFRDDIYLDDQKHSLSYSNNMQREDLFIDVIKMIEEILEEEIGYYKTAENLGTLREYYRLLKNKRISNKLIAALKVSFSKYYKYDIPKKLLLLIDNLEDKCRNEKAFNPV